MPKKTSPGKMRLKEYVIVGANSVWQRQIVNTIKIISRYMLTGLGLVMIA